MQIIRIKKPQFCQTMSKNFYEKSDVRVTSNKNNNSKFNN